MPEAVIVATGRTPIGRASKGSLVELRADDLAALVVREVMARIPQLDPHGVEDVILGCGFPMGEAGFNIGRVVAVLAGLSDVRASRSTDTAHRPCRQIRMAAHAIRAGEGDVFVAAGVDQCRARTCCQPKEKGPSTRSTQRRHPKIGGKVRTYR